MTVAFVESNDTMVFVTKLAEVKAAMSGGEFHGC